MSCLSYSTGLFYNTGTGIEWKMGNRTETLSDGTTVEIDISGASPGITIDNGSTSQFIAEPLSGTIYYMAYGSPISYLLVMTVDSSGNTYVTHINVSDGSLDTTSVGSVWRSSSSIPLPNIQMSPGAGDMFLTYMTNGTTTSNIIMRRSDNADILCSTSPFTPSQQIFGNITATNLEILEGSTVRASCDLPQHDCDVSPGTHTFPDIVIGSGVDASLASHTEQFTITNNGTDCLEITSISDGTVFSVAGTSSPLPLTLAPGDDLDVDVEFSTSTIGNYSESLAINPTPTEGDTSLDCEGEARAANLSISYSSNLNFGSQPVGSTDTRSVTITNNGEADISLAIPASTGSNFTWSAYSGTLSRGGSYSLSISFNPSAETNYSQSISFTSGASSSPHSINLSGEGCVANAEMVITVPSGPYIDLGEVQQGFRTVATITVQNTGDGPLNFDARISGTDASLFGIQEDGGSITSPLSNNSFTVLPVSACGGSTGSGEVVFGVTFYANDSVGTAQAELIFENHNATNGLSSTITHNLQAEIIQPVSVDAELVMDRSGSMADPSGGQIKSDVAINAGQLFVELFRPDVEDRIGIVSFNDTPNVVSGIQNVTSANQGTISNDINSTNFNPTGATSIAGGVRVAEKDIDNNPRSTTPSDLNSMIVVLTDGQDNTPYTDPDDGVTYSLLGTESGTTALPAPTGKKLYAVGIGDSIDTARLSVLANATSGDFLHIRDFSGTDFFSLEKHFTQIFMDAVDLSVISDPVYNINVNEQHVIEFDILRGDTGLMTVIYDQNGIRIPFYLEAPNGETIDITSIPPGFQLRSGISNTARFIELKFPPQEANRYAGKWKVILKHDGKACFYSPKSSAAIAGNDNEMLGFGFRPDNKCQDNYTNPIMYGIAIGAGSNFRMTPFVDPGIVKVGEPVKLNALVTEFGLPVTGSKVTLEVETPNGTIYNYDMHDDGAHEDDDADDGNYGKSFTQTHQEGNYNFTFRVSGMSRDGEPVKREAVRSKFIEGTTPLIPEKPEGGTPQKGNDDDCCSKITKILWGILIMMVAMIILIFFR